MAESELNPPFDLLATRMLRYIHRGKDIDEKEAVVAQGKLTEMLARSTKQRDVDSPVYAMLPNLVPPRR